MGKRTLILLALLVMTITQTTAQTERPKLVDKFIGSKNPNEISLPFQKWVYPNGLTLIIHEDKSDPIVHVDVTYHVGSAREEIGKSGFAHFFEHMMFQGSKHVGDEEHFKIVTEAGGTMNGTTNRDRTNYYETLPKNYLETALWLEADRMGFLLEAVTQEKFEIQRATVKNEKGQRYENRPYGMTGEITYKNLYPYAHPYSWPTIGFLEDLDRVDVDDLKKFFLRWYGPNNAVVTVGGDVNPEEVVNLVGKYFGSIPRGPEVEKMEWKPFELEKNRYVSYEDNIRFPMLRVTYPSVPAYHPDEAPLDVLAEVLGQGKSSILYQNFVKTQKALQASAMNPAFELAGEFVFTVVAFPGTTLSDLEAMLQESIAEFEKRGVSQEDLAKAKAKKQADAIYGLESVSGKVSQLASYETFLGTPHYVNKDIERYKNVTAADIKRVFEKYIKGQNALYLSVYPKGQKNVIAKEDNYTPSVNKEAEVHFNYDTLQERTVADAFDRSKRPAPGAGPAIVSPEHFKFSFPNGINLIGVTNKEVPDVYMEVHVSNGQWREPKGKAGIAYLLSRMLQESTEAMTAEELASEFEKLGSRVWVSAGEEDIVVHVMSLKNNLMQTAHLVSEMMTHPKFDAEEFERNKKQQLEAIANQAVQPNAIADAVFHQVLYGEEHALANPTYGSKESVESISLDDLKQYYAKTFIPSLAQIVVSGDVEEHYLRGMLEPLNHWMPAGIHDPAMMASTPDGTIGDDISTEKIVTLPQAKAIDKTKIYLVNKENAPQSEIRVGYVALPYDATDEFFKANLMNYILGGAFNSRINLNLREDKGWTYGARSYFGGNHNPGTFTVYTGVKGSATDSAVAEILKEITEYRDKGISKEELLFTKNSILEREALKYETNSQKASFIRRIIDYDLPSDVAARQTSIIKGIKQKEVNKLAKKYLPVGKMAIVVVGDAASARPGLEKLGYEIVQIEADEAFGMK